MNKNTILKILNNTPISLEELNSFISGYINKMHNINIKAEELSLIIEMINMGVFNLRYAASIAATILNLNLTTVIGKGGEIIKVF
jgi:predicted transcriptional regulator YheO